MTTRPTQVNVLTDHGRYRITMATDGKPVATVTVVITPDMGRLVQIARDPNGNNLQEVTLLQFFLEKGKQIGYADPRPGGLPGKIHSIEKIEDEDPSPAS